MRTFVFTCLLLLGMTTFAQDANFHIYLCLGQSNMEGNAKVEEQDTVAVDSRFQVLAAVDCPNLGRTKGNWYKAVPEIWFAPDISSKPNSILPLPNNL